MDGFEPGRECMVCKGRCCREKGCSLSPKDMIKALEKADSNRKKSSMGDENFHTDAVSLAEEKLLSFLQEEDNLYSIDCFYTPQGPVYYLRMRHKNYTFIGVDAIGECIALTKDGCSLSMERRPKGGRFLESRPDGHCIQHYDKEQMMEDWMPYQKLLKEIWDIYYQRFTQDGTFDRCDEAHFAWMRQQR